MLLEHIFYAFLRTKLEKELQDMLYTRLDIHSSTVAYFFQKRSSDAEPKSSKNLSNAVDHGY